MDEQQDKGRLQIDSDWKTEAAQEKERLAEADEAVAGPPGEIGFADLVNLLAMQAAVGLGGVKTPAGETVPPNPQIAKQYIDQLHVLEQKTAGQLTEDEKKMLDAVLYELRIQYVAFASAQGPAPAGAAPSPG